MLKVSFLTIALLGLVGISRALGQDRAATIPPAAREGLVAHWDFGSGKGDALQDRSGNGNHGTIKGATWIKTPWGNGLEFDGVADHVDCGDGPTLDLQDKLSMMAWIRPRREKQGGEAGVIGKAFVSYGMTMSGGNVATYISGGPNSARMPVSLDSWHHVACTYDGNTLRLYIDGYQVSERPLRLKVLSGGRFWMGRSDGELRWTKDAHFHGSLADVRVYNRALSLAEIRVVALTRKRADRPPSWEWKEAIDLEDRAIYVSDMSRCTPDSALSAEPQAGRWFVMPYETVEPNLASGKMIGAISYNDAPHVTLPLDKAGWHAVYVGYWNPHYVYDADSTTVKVRLSDDRAFLRITDGSPSGNTKREFLKEAFFKVADLTGRDLVFGKENGIQGRKAYIAYVKLVPLTPDQVAAVKADRARTDTRILQLTIDGTEPFNYGKQMSEGHIRELVERYRHSDVGKVIWAVCYGDMINYPTKVGYYFAGEAQVPVLTPPSDNAYAAHRKSIHDARVSFDSKGIIPQAIAAEHVHRMGLKFDIMFRLGILGHLPPRPRAKDACFIDKHPQFRMVMRDGTPVETASYAFEQTRYLMLSIIREASGKFDIDGINLCFVRGSFFSMYETPVLDDFRKLCGEDARNYDHNDPRLHQVRAAYLTQFVRDARRILDEIGEKKGKRLEMSAYVFPQSETNYDCAIDVADWMKQGLLDSVLSLGGPLDAELAAIAKQNNCRNIAGVSDPRTAQMAIAAGADGLVGWDFDNKNDSPTQWPAIGRIGHRDELPLLARQAIKVREITIKTICGRDILQGLWYAAYSGG